MNEAADNETWGNRIVSFFTVGEFTELFQDRNMLALLIFAFLTGLQPEKQENRDNLSGLSLLRDMKS
jgi:hypothetical protein